MRDAAGQRAHGLELLRGAQPHFELLALALCALATGDVLDRTRHATRPTAIVAHEQATLPHPVPVVGVVRIGLPVGARDAHLDVVVGCPALQVLDQCVAHALPVMRVVMQQGKPGAPRLHRLAGRQAACLLRTLGEESAIGREVPIPQPFVGARHCERVSLFRHPQRALGRAQRRARRLQAPELAQHHGQQSERGRAQQRGPQHAAPRILAPGREHQVDVACDHDLQRVAEHGLRDAEALDAVDAADVAARHQATTGAVESSRPASDRLPDSRVKCRVACDQRAVAAGERDHVAGAKLDTGIEALEVAHVEQRADAAVEAAVGCFEAVDDRQVPAVVCGRADHAVDNRAGNRAALQPLERGPVGDARRCGGKLVAAGDAPAVGAGDDDRRHVAQLVALALQVFVQLGAASPRAVDPHDARRRSRAASRRPFATSGASARPARVRAR